MSLTSGHHTFEIFLKGGVSLNLYCQYSLIDSNLYLFIVCDETPLLYGHIAIFGPTISLQNDNVQLFRLLAEI